MLQTLREQQKLLMIVLFVVVVVAFGFLYNASDTGFGQNAVKDANVFVRIDNRPVHSEEARKISGQAENLAKLSGAVYGPYFLGYYFDSPEVAAPYRQSAQEIGNFLGLLGHAGPVPVEVDEQGQPTNAGRDALRRNQLTNLLTLREYADDLGIAVSADEVTTAMGRLALLANPATGRFDRDRLDLLIGSELPISETGEVINLSSLGSDREALLRGIIRDWLTFEAVRAALAPAANLPSEAMASDARLRDAQTEAWTVTARAEDFLPDESEVDEEELALWYEDNRETFYRPETRKVLLIVGRAATGGPDESSAEDSEENSEELLTGANEPLDAEALPEISDAAWEDVHGRYAEFYAAVIEGTDLHEAAAEHGLEVTEVTDINRETPPGIFADDPALLELAMETPPAPDWTLSKVAEQRERNRIVSLRVVDVEEPQPRELDEVREMAAPAYRRHLAGKDRDATLAEARESLGAAWDAGGIEEYEPADERVQVEGPRYFGGPASPGRPLDLASRTVPVGEFTETIDLPGTGAARGFALVAARRLDSERAENLADGIERSTAQSEERLGQLLLIDWLGRGRRVHNIYVPGAPEDAAGDS